MAKMNKKQQHYVWRYYLEAWGNDGKVYCLGDKNRIFNADSKNLGVEHNFYRFEEINDFDMKIIRELIIDRSPLLLQPQHIKFVKTLYTIFMLKKLCKKPGEIDLELEEIDVLVNNLGENYHCNIERDSRHYMEEIRHADMSFYDTEQGKIVFYHFIATQLLRTKRTKESIISNLNDTSKIEGSLLRMKIAASITKNWNTYVHVFATNMGYSLLRSDMKLFLLKNDTDTPFITGDQPVINLKTDYSNFDPPEELELYYPQTPNLALLLTDGSSLMSSEYLTEEDVVQLNNSIVSASYKQVYANEPKVLEQYKLKS